MGMSFTVFAGAVVSSTPLYHPAYRDQNSNKIITSRLVFDVAVNTANRRKGSFFKNLIIWDKMADKYAHCLYKGKYITAVCSTTAEDQPLRGKGGHDFIVDFDGTPVIQPRYTFTINYLELGQDSSDAIDYRNGKADKEIRAGLLLPAWNQPLIKRTSGTSDFEIYRDWFKTYIHEPYAGQPRFFGHALVKMWPGQDDLVIRGNKMPPPKPRETRELGDYVVDGDIIPFDEYLEKAMKRGLENPLEDQLNDPTIAAMADERRDRLIQSPVATILAGGLKGMFG